MLRCALAPIKERCRLFRLLISNAQTNNNLPALQTQLKRRNRALLIARMLLVMPLSEAQMKSFFHLSLSWPIFFNSSCIKWQLCSDSLASFDENNTVFGLSDTILLSSHLLLTQRQDMHLFKKTRKQTSMHAFCLNERKHSAHQLENYWMEAHKTILSDDSLLVLGKYLVVFDIANDQ